MADKRVAVTLPGGPRVRDTIERARWAEQRGYTDAWFSDGNAPDSMTMAAVLGDHTERLRVGVAVTPVYTRTPAVLAATAQAVGEILPGRFITGLGSSSHTMMEGWNGVKLDRPLTRVKETALLVRSMLAGEKSNFDGETLHSHGYRQMPMENPPPIYIAALRPKMLEMATQVGDGVILNLWPKGALEKMMRVKADAARACGKDPDAVEVVNRFMVCVTDDVEKARGAFRANFAPYYATPVYNRFLAWAGYEEAAQTIAEGWAQKDRNKTSGALTDDLVHEIGVIGSADECRERIRWALDTGIDTAIIAPIATSREDMEATYEAFTADNFQP